MRADDTHIVETRSVSHCRLAIDKSRASEKTSSLTMSRCTPANDVMNHALRVHLAVMAHLLFHCNVVGNERTYGRVEEPKNRRGL